MLGPSQPRHKYTTPTTHTTTTTLLAHYFYYYYHHYYYHYYYYPIWLPVLDDERVVLLLHYYHHYYYSTTLLLLLYCLYLYCMMSVLFSCVHESAFSSMGSFIRSRSSMSMRLKYFLFVVRTTSCRVLGLE